MSDPTATLAEALHALRSRLFCWTYGDPRRVSSGCRPNAVRHQQQAEAILALLARQPAAPAAPAEPGLDVGRLRRAIAASTNDYISQDAEAIAAAYAAEPQSDG